MTGSIYCWAATNVGRVREGNEDAFLTSGQDVQDESGSWEGWLQADGWALLADGMGGHAAGEVASQLAVQCMASLLPALSSAEEVSAAIEVTNEALFQAMDMRPELKGMGTTLAGVKLLGSTALLFNVGDSRIYCLSDGKLCQVSEDHVVGGYMLTKCLGGVSGSEPVGGHVTSAPLGDHCRILMCTDGVTDELHDEVIQMIIEHEDPAGALVSAAVTAGGRDNATAIVLRF